jgi:hypothetical protein
MYQVLVVSFVIKLQLNQLVEVLASSSALLDFCIGGRWHISKIKKMFYWAKLKETVIEIVRTCDVCQLNKSEHIHSPGLLQLLPRYYRSIFSLVEAFPLDKIDELAFSFH